VLNDPLSEQRQFIAPLLQEYISPVFSDLLDKAPWYAGIAIGVLVVVLVLVMWLTFRLRRFFRKPETR
jgi:hypothetical protein